MKRFEKIVVATRNPSKVLYYKPILEKIAKRVMSLSDFNLEGKPEEIGVTAEENAKIKALYYVRRVRLPVFSEDEALYADFLTKLDQPGTHVRRINGVDEVDDDRLLAHWERIILPVPEEKRTGKWHIAYCIATPDDKYRVVGLDHPILFFSPPSKVRYPGWPMSSLQGSLHFGKPHSEQTSEEREVSKKRTADELIKCLESLL